MRIALRRTGWTIVALIAAYLCAAAIGGLISGQAHEEGANIDRPHKIHLVSGPIHVDFLLPLDATTRAHFAALTPHGIDVQNAYADWLLVGWGAHEFYTSTGSYTDLSATAVWRGITGDNSVLRVDTVGPLLEPDRFAHIDLTEKEYSRLRDAILASFDTTPRGDLRPLDAPGFTQTDRFFAAKGRFNILRTCNTWIARVLRASGVRFGVWTPTPYAVTLSLWRFHPQ